MSTRLDAIPLRAITPEAIIMLWSNALPAIKPQAITLHAQSDWPSAVTRWAR